MPTTNQNKMLSRETIIDLIADGKAIVIYQQLVLNLTAWLPLHPGGEKAVYHMIGRDATDEMNAYHGEETIGQFRRWRIGEIDYVWENLLPPIQGAVYQRRLKREGLEDKIDKSGGDGGGSSSEGELELDLTSMSSVEEKDGGGDKDEVVKMKLDKVVKKMELDKIVRKTELDEVVKNMKLDKVVKKIELKELKMLKLKLEEMDRDEKSMESKTNYKYRGLGFPQGRVKAKVPQDFGIVNAENVNQVFPIVKDDTIVDPKLSAINYDNEKSQQDVLDMPSLDYQTQAFLRQKYENLHQTVIKHGFYNCDYWAYVRELVKIGSLFLYSFSCLKLNYIFLSAALMGFAWHQMTFIAHDAGHVSITHNYQFDNLFGMLIADWFGGLSLGWWKRNHNVHHLITNDPVHDPDIQHLPFFAVSTRLLGDVYSTYYEKYLPLDAVARKMIQIQDYLYYPILCFGRFNLYRLSWVHLIRGDGPRHGKAAWFRYFELVGLSFFFYWFFYLIVTKSITLNWDRFVFVMVSHIATMMVHVQITLSHFAMSTSDLGMSESFPLRQIRTTMDVDCPEWLDFFHGGLQFQAIHHLFPRLPRHNLRKVQPFVIDFCREVGLHYSIYGFGEGNEIVIGKLAEVGKQCSIMLEATKKLKEHDH